MADVVWRANQESLYTGGGEFSGGSELVWDTDLSFEGFAGTVRHRLGGSDSLMEATDQSRSVFVTAGPFHCRSLHIVAISGCSAASRRGLGLR